MNNKAKQDEGYGFWYAETDSAHFVDHDARGACSSCPFFAAIFSLEHLQEGDLILTGMPSGVGPVNPGDRVSCTLEDIASGKTLATLDFDTVQREGDTCLDLDPRCN